MVSVSASIRPASGRGLLRTHGVRNCDSRMYGDPPSCSSIEHLNARPWGEVLATHVFAVTPVLAVAVLSAAPRLGFDRAFALHSAQTGGPVGLMIRMRLAHVPTFDDAAMDYHSELPAYGGSVTACKRLTALAICVLVGATMWGCAETARLSVAQGTGPRPELPAPRRWSASVMSWAAIWCPIT